MPPPPRPSDSLLLPLPLTQLSLGYPSTSFSYDGNSKQAFVARFGDRLKCDQRAAYLPLRAGEEGEDEWAAEVVVEPEEQEQEQEQEEEGWDPRVGVIKDLREGGKGKRKEQQEDGSTDSNGKSERAATSCGNGNEKDQEQRVGAMEPTCSMAGAGAKATPSLSSSSDDDDENDDDAGSGSIAIGGHGGGDDGGQRSKREGSSVVSHSSFSLAMGKDVPPHLTSSPPPQRPSRVASSSFSPSHYFQAAAASPLPPPQVSTLLLLPSRGEQDPSRLHLTCFFGSYSTDVLNPLELEVGSGSVMPLRREREGRVLRELGGAGVVVVGGGGGGGGRGKEEGEWKGGVQFHPSFAPGPLGAAITSMTLHLLRPPLFWVSSNGVRRRGTERDGLLDGGYEGEKPLRWSGRQGGVGVERGREERSALKFGEWSLIRVGMYASDAKRLYERMREEEHWEHLVRWEEEEEGKGKGGRTVNLEGEEWARREREEWEREKGKWEGESWGVRYAVEGLLSFNTLRSSQLSALHTLSHSCVCSPHSPSSVPSAHCTSHSEHKLERTLLALFRFNRGIGSNQELDRVFRDAAGKVLERPVVVERLTTRGGGGALGKETMVLVPKVLITPTRVLLYPPEPQEGNFILSRFPLAVQERRFLRVQFWDENGRLSMNHDQRSSDAQDEKEGILARFRRVLREGIVVAGRRFVFLDYAASQARKGAFWAVWEGQQGQKGVMAAAAAAAGGEGELVARVLEGVITARRALEKQRGKQEWEWEWENLSWLEKDLLPLPPGAPKRRERSTLAFRLDPDLADLLEYVQASAKARKLDPPMTEEEGRRAAGALLKLETWVLTATTERHEVLVQVMERVEKKKGLLGEKEQGPQRRTAGFFGREMIRGWMGQFDKERIVAKHAARRGQLYSTSRKVTLIQHVHDVPDFKSPSGGCYSDGCSPCSGDVVEAAVKAMRGGREQEEEEEEGGKVSAVQFRMGGSKGVLVHWGPEPRHPPTTGTQVQGPPIFPYLQWPTFGNNNQKEKSSMIMRRPSQKKFESSVGELRAVNVSGYADAYLNREVLNLLYPRGLSQRDIKRLYSTHIKSIIDFTETCTHWSCSSSSYSCSDALDLTSLRPSVLGRTALPLLSLLSSSFHTEPFLQNVLSVLAYNALWNIKWKAKILVPEGAGLMGVVDELGVLEEGEIFVRVDDGTVSGSGAKGRRTIQRDCIIFRAPTRHPGDVQHCKAVSHPALEASELVNVVVFNRKGARDLPSMLGGGDLDGDMFTVIWDPKFVAIRKAEPMDYTPPEPIRAQGPKGVTNAMVRDFHTEYMRDDCLGAISNSHLAISDLRGPDHPDALLLAQLHSIAVDFAKTGVPATLPKELKPEARPDFMGPPMPGGRSYESQKPLGKLFRDPLLNPLPRPVEPTHSVLDPRLSHCVPECFNSFARQLKGAYDLEVGALRARFENASEAEVVAGVVLPRLDGQKGLEKDFNNVKDPLDCAFREIKSAIFQAVDEFLSLPSVVSAATEAGEEGLHLFVRAAYQVTHELSTQKGARRKLSFPWLWARELVEMVKPREASTSSGDEEPLTPEDGLAGEQVSHLKNTK